MTVRLIARFAALAALALGAAAAIASDGSPARSRTGAPAIGAYPAESNCSGCHSGNALNTGGSVSLVNPPAWYRPGRTYRLTLQLASSQTSGATNRRWGFQMTALDPTGAPAGAFANVAGQGTMIATGTGSYAGRQYIEVDTGNHAGAASPVTWQLDWTAPATGVGSVSFWFVGEAANGSGNTSGDWVYLNGHALGDTTTPALPATWGEIKKRYR